MSDDEIKRLLRIREDLWATSKPWTNNVLHGGLAVERQNGIDRQLTAVRDQLLALGYRDHCCKPREENSNETN